MTLWSIGMLLGIMVLQGHDLYIFPDRFFVDTGSRFKTGFHNGDAFPVSEASPVLSRVRDTNAISAAGTAPMTELKIEGKRGTAMVSVQHSGARILTVRTVPNLIALQPAQFLAYIQEEGLQHVIDWRTEHHEAQKPGRERYSKYAKSLVIAGASDGFFSHEVGFPIEIIPEADPSKAKPGASLPIRVKFKGQPAPGLQVEAAWSDKRQNKTTIPGRTDSDGRLSIKLDQPGFWRIQALKMERCAEPAVADWESYWASLTFELR
jgi:hypothetical protein